MKRKITLYVILAALVLVGGGTGGYFWYEGQHYISTDDSRLAGDIYKVMPRITGKVTSLQISEGDHVLADQIIGQQDTNNLTTSNMDQSTLRSPIDGTVIKTMVKTGEVSSPGQTVAMVVDTKKLYVSANIEETEIYKVREGQPVEIHVDNVPGQVLMGKVKEVGKATASTFSLLPSTNTSGNFTKVTQRVPIKISIDNTQGLDLSPGISTAIKIHLKGN